MGIETVGYYNPLHAQPVYVHVRAANRNDLSTGEVAQIRYDDEGRAHDGQEGGAFNYAHEALTVAQRTVRYDALDPRTLALAGFTNDRQTAIERVFPGGKEPDDDRKLTVIVFVRMDKMKEWIETGMEPIEPPFEKQDCEA